MKSSLNILLTCFGMCVFSEAEEKMITIEPQLPKPVFVDGRDYMDRIRREVPNLEKPKPDEKPGYAKSFLAAEGTVNLAKNKPVSSSSLENNGSLELIVDGDADARPECIVTLAPGPQWIQIDLGATSELAKLWLWHNHLGIHLYYDVVVQLSDDPYFQKDVQTIFNNDHDDTLKLGKGNDPAYVEWSNGRLIDAGRKKARYVRLYSNGNFSEDGNNHYTEVMVFGLPGKKPYVRREAD
jgi:hypothetical protein